MPSAATEQALLDAALALARTLEVRQICAAVLDTVERLFGARSAWILVHDPAGDELTTVECRGRDADVYSGVRLRSHEGIVGIVFREQRDVHPVGAVVGDSATFRGILDQVAMVAPSDSTVLLVGETGTGKELIARAVHERSRRRGKPFVAVNCAALPDTLVESELFGDEKGAFTGAFARKAGKFELAQLGTLFLDEIGDLPSQAQAKLLRVLQEREVHRIGGLEPLPVDVRLIAATNRDLAASMDAEQFRPDLFYRISVFPIRLPPWRERRGDIPPLVTYFLRRFAERQHKPTPRVSAEVLERLTTYEWPGNIRALQNVIERAVILVRGAEIGMDLIAFHQFQPETLAPPPASAAAGAPPAERAAAENVIRFTDAERPAIVRALEACGWRISGRHAAAETLGLKPTTLHAKMKKLGIVRPSAPAAPANAAALPS